MDSVAFISTETGDDLIVAFAVQDPDDPREIESPTLLRTPKYEFLLEETRARSYEPDLWRAPA
jgi:hypothetical protein